MAAIEPGKICIKITGREAGQRCVIVEVIDKNYVLITGPPSVNKVRRRRSNVKHLEVTRKRLKLNAGLKTPKSLNC